MEMLPAVCPIVYILITGAFTVIKAVFTDLSPGDEFFKVAVDGGLPNTVFRIPEMPHYLINRNMTAPQKSHIIEDKFSLPGTIACRAFTFHGDTRLAKFFSFVNMEMVFIFILTQTLKILLTLCE
jgi:hypothetical protein